MILYAWAYELGDDGEFTAMYSRWRDHKAADILRPVSLAVPEGMKIDFDIDGLSVDTSVILQPGHWALMLEVPE